MPIAPVKEMLAEAARGRFAVGYFESWNLDSLLAVGDAARSARSPVLLGCSGIFHTHPDRLVSDPLSVHAAMGLEICRSLPVPANLVFNESPQMDAVLQAIELHFGLVMFSNETMSPAEQLAGVRRVVAAACGTQTAVEGEPSPVPGVSGGLDAVPSDLHLTEAALARQFLEQTGVDALAVNIGQAHLHGRRQVRLDLTRLAALKREIKIPLVLHGSSSVHPDDLAQASQLGICKINVGSRLKQVYFRVLRQSCSQAGDEANPYHVVGSGLKSDVLVPARLALQAEVEQLMALFGSAGRA
jgi:fructose/tagatose bisphosphate aldolase